VRLGDAVTQSQPVITIQSPESDAAVSALMQAEAAVAQARIALTKAQADADRYHDLLQHNAVAQKDVLNADSVVAQSRAALDQFEAARKQAAGRLILLGWNRQVRPGGARAGAHVGKGPRHRDCGRRISQRHGRAGDDHRGPEHGVGLRRRSRERHSARRPGRAGGHRADGVSGRDLPRGGHAHRRHRGPADAHGEGAGRARQPKGRLRPEMFARVRHTHSMPVLPVVPSSAVVQEQGKNVVYREESRGVFAAVPVRTSEPVKGMVPILEGLRAGDRIVTGGVMLLKRG